MPNQEQEPFNDHPEVGDKIWVHDTLSKLMVRCTVGSLRDANRPNDEKNPIMLCVNNSIRIIEAYLEKVPGTANDWQWSIINGRVMESDDDYADLIINFYEDPDEELQEKNTEKLKAQLQRYITSKVRGAMSTEAPDFPKVEVGICLMGGQSRRRRSQPEVLSDAIEVEVGSQEQEEFIEKCLELVERTIYNSIKHFKFDPSNANDGLPEEEDED